MRHPVRMACTCSFVVAALAAPHGAADRKAAVMSRIDAKSAAYRDLSRRIWELAEPGYQERESAALLVHALREAGFRVREQAAGLPTAFVAEWGSGTPVIGIMGEYDALPGLSQDLVPVKQPRVADGYGHGCGHNLLGAASALAAVAVKETLEADRLPGTIRFYGTPAEEGGGGKIYMIRAGVFVDADVVLHWHPGDRTIATTGSTLAIIGARFRFVGRAAHAASAPDQGRSALDAVMLMGHAVDMLREHVPTASRMHYIVSRGGDAPNIVPADAELYLYARHPHMRTLDGIWQRIVKCAEGAALATETTIKVELVNSDYEVLPNDSLSTLFDRNLRIVGGITYTPAEEAFAEQLRATLTLTDPLPLGSQSTIRPRDEPLTLGSTDAGDVSWMVPTGWFMAATNVPGVPNHSWQATACTGGSIGQKGMLLAAKALALSAVDLLTDPSQVKAARDSFEKGRAGLQYRSRIPPDMPPPLTYRKK
jgi:aminobenzoyl-glutamate utilization protein B